MQQEDILKLVQETQVALLLDSERCKDLKPETYHMFLKQVGDLAIKQKLAEQSGKVADEAAANYKAMTEIIRRNSGLTIVQEDDEEVVELPELDPTLPELLDLPDDILDSFTFGDEELADKGKTIIYKAGHIVEKEDD